MIYVLVLTPLGGMLLVYRPETLTRGRVAPEWGGSINRNILTRGVIISLELVARWLHKEV